VKDLVKFYKRVVQWNDKCGVQDHPPFSTEWWKAIELQTKLLVEESTEAYDASKYGDAVELLDGAIDNMVIAFKFLDMLDKAGYDINGAFEAICANNDAKIFDSFYEACESKEKLEERDDTEYTISTAVENGLPYYTIRRLDMKIMKPIDFVPVDLSEYLPK
jgi:hypothetical protein